MLIDLPGWNKELHRTIDEANKLWLQSSRFRILFWRKVKGQHIRDRCIGGKSDGSYGPCGQGPVGLKGERIIIPIS